jgi:hypothetical protein
MKNTAKLQQLADALKLVIGDDDDDDSIEIADGVDTRKVITDALERCDSFREDATLMPFFARELEHVFSETYDVEYPDLKAANGEVLAIDTSVPAGAKTWHYYQYDGVGVAKFMGSEGHDLPTVMLTAQEFSGTTQSIGNAYQWTLDDIEAAQFAKGNLSRELPEKARRGHDQLWNTTWLFGATAYSLPGLVNHPNITIALAPVKSGGSTDAHRTWVQKSVDEIIADITTLVDTPDELTDGLEEVKEVWLPRAQFNLLKRRRMGTGDGTLTLMKYLNENFNVEFKILDELAATKSGDALAFDCALASPGKNPKKASFVMCRAFEQRPPQEKDLVLKVNCRSKIGGVKMHRPLAFVRLDKI